MLGVEGKGKCNSKQRLLGFIAALGVMLGIINTAWARVPEPYAIEPVQLQAAAQLPKTLADGLDSQGLRIFTYENGVKMNVCEIFWAKAVAEQDVPAGSSKLVYGSLKPGAFVGVIHFLPEADQEYRKDFRDQKLKPGYYTMRYGVMEAGIGEHGPEPGDFVVLSPAALDRDATRVLPRNELIRLSRMASHTKEPAVMSLIEVTVARKTFPDVTTDYAGTCVLQVKLHLKPRKGGTVQDLAMAIVVLTPLVEGEGS
jgi:hypothetical protein